MKFLRHFQKYHFRTTFLITYKPYTRAYYTKMKNQTKTIAIIAMVAIFAAVGIVATVAVQTIVTPQQAFADPPRGNSFGNCHSFGPGHSDDACR